MADVGTIYLMRHGQSVVNIERRLTCHEYGGDLTPLGRQQACRAADWLADKAIETIRHSPFCRAEQTARIVGESLGIVPQVDDDLREMDCGNLESRTDDEAWSIWAGVFKRWLRHDTRATFPGGESYADGLRRFSRALDRTNDSVNVLLVTHGGITRTVVPYLCVNAAALQRTENLANTGMVVLERYDPGRYVCLSWNLAEHLDQTGGTDG
jgi:broad specificity phosphatase PhoE